MLHRIRSRLLHPLVVMPLGATVLVAGWFGFQQVRGSAGESTNGQPSEQIVEATTGEIAQTVSAQGTVAYDKTEDLSFTAAGTVDDVAVEAGDEVQEGDVLATMDSPSLAADVADAESAVADAEATLADHENAGASDAQLDADQASVDAAAANLDEAKEALEGAKLVASFDGVVAAVNVTEGEELGSGGTNGVSASGSGSGSGNAGPTLGDSSQPSFGGNNNTSSSGDTDPHIKLVSGSVFTVDIGVDEGDVEKLKDGQEAVISLSTSSGSSGFPFPGGGGFRGGGAFPGGGGFPGLGGQQDDDEDSSDATVSDVDSATGKVTEVGTIADASSGVAEYPVKVSFKDASGDYNAGANVLVEITYATVQNAVQVPALAITSDGGGSTVTVVGDDGARETRSVTTGLRSGTMVQITQGLQAGEQVVVGLPSFLRGNNGGAGGNNPAGGPGGGGGGPAGGAFPGGASARGTS